MNFWMKILKRKKIWNSISNLRSIKYLWFLLGQTPPLNGCCRYDWGIIAKRGKMVQSCPLDPILYLSSVEKLQISHSKNCNSKHTSTFIPLVYCKIQFSSKVLFSQGVTHKACIFRLEYLHSRFWNMSECFRFYVQRLH